MTASLERSRGHWSYLWVEGFFIDVTACLCNRKVLSGLLSKLLDRTSQVSVGPITWSLGTDLSHDSYADSHRLPLFHGAISFVYY